MSEFDWKAVTDRCKEAVRAYKATKDPWPNEEVAAQGTPICQCGKSLWFHRIDRKKAPRDQGDCDGFKLARVDVQVCRVVQLPIQTSS